jgi:uncharacterized protein YutE (UPF0331/DUF86 family)
MKHTYASAVTERLAAMREYLDELGPVAGGGLAAYLADSRLRRAGERLLQLVVESASDAARMLMLGRGYNPGPSHAACFQNMGKRRLLSRELADRLVEYVSLRNVVVHDYLTLDDTVVFHQIEQAETIFGEFLNEMMTALRH